MADSFEIREAVAEDAAAIQAVARASWHTAYDDLLGEDTVTEYVNAWFDPEKVVADDVEPADRDLFVAEGADEVIGFAETTLDGDETAVLYRIYVAPDAHGDGVGTALLERAEAAAAERGRTRLRLSVVAPNEDAVAFYEARGFERVDTVRDDEFDCNRYQYENRIAA